MLAGMSLGTELKRFSRGLMPRVALVTIVLMPLLYGALYLWAFWDPFSAANKIPVALVNSDHGTVVDGKPLNAGDQVAQGLMDSGELDFHEVTAYEASTGVADGRYCPATSASRWPPPPGRIHRRPESSSRTTTPTTTSAPSSGRTRRSRFSTP